MSNPSLAERIDALLPQTQCTRCGYPTCRDYADALAADRADLNQCPPGGADGVAALAALLDRAEKPLDPAYGVEAPPRVALIDEDTCIGCTKCIQACPVDAIVGAAKRMHTIIASECTGCELCVPPCPVDCIAIVPIADAPLARADVLARATLARRRFDARKVRLAAKNTSKSPAGAASAAMPSIAPSSGARSIAAEAAPANVLAPASAAAPPITRSAVLEAIARGRARKSGETP